MVDEIHLFEKALTADEIAGLYDSTQQRPTARLHFLFLSEKIEILNNFYCILRLFDIVQQQAGDKLRESSVLPS